MITFLSYLFRRLLTCCPRLKRLGRLINLKEHAGGQGRDNYLELLDRKVRENWDCDITWVTPATKVVVPVTF